MSTHMRADAEEVSTTARRRAVAALVRAPRIPQRRRETTPETIKRAAVVLRRGMKQSEFRQIEAQLDAHDLTCLPVLAGQRRMAVSETPVCGFIITGGDMDPSNAERELIGDAVRDTIERDVPVLAMSEAVGMVLDAAGVQGAVAGGRAILLHKGVRVLESAKDVDDAIKFMAKSPAR
jgi:hypothetical protein